MNPMVMGTLQPSVLSLAGALGLTVWPWTDCRKGSGGLCKDRQPGGMDFCPLVSDAAGAEALVGQKGQGASCASTPVRAVAL